MGSGLNLGTRCYPEAKPFQERWVPGRSRTYAHGALLRVLETATFLAYEDAVKEIWSGTYPDASDPVLLVVVNHVVETVLPPGTRKRS